MPTVLNHVDVVWEARLTLVSENEINVTWKLDKTPTSAGPDRKTVKQGRVTNFDLFSYPDRKWAAGSY